MNNRVLVIFVAVFFAAFSGVGLAIDNPAIGNPGRNPIYIGSNPAVAGNSNFGAVTSSSSLDSFLRRSLGSRDFGRYNRGTYRSFYPPSRTVTTRRPGEVSVIRPPTVKIGGDTAGYGAIGTSPFVSRKQTLSYHGDWGFGGRDGSPDPASFQVRKNPLRFTATNPGARSQRPMSMTLMEMERAILAEVGTEIYQGKDRMQPRGEATAGQKSWSKEFRWTPEGMTTVNTGVTKNLIERDESLWPRTTKVWEGDTLRHFELQRLKEEALEDKDKKGKHDKEQGIEFDVYEQMKQRIDELQKRYKQLVAGGAAEGTTGAAKGVWERSRVATYRDIVPEYKGADNGEKVSSEEHSGFAVSARRGKKRLGRFDVEAIGANLTKLGHPSLERPGSSKVRISDGMRGARGADLSARTKAILGSYRSLESFWNDKFNQHVAAGEKYFKDGRYYRSAGAYTLALIYKPEEPLAYMGKSHALFAAGEYVSSALFLSRAIAAASQGREAEDYNVEQLLALGSQFLSYIDRDKLESRLADVERWQERSNSTELQFLLGYIYYQMGRLDAAWEAIDGAYKKMPEAPAVIALREVIGSKKQPQQGKNP